MKFVLKDGLVHIVENHGLPNNTIEGSVEAPGLDGFSLSYSVNDKKYVELDRSLLKIPNEDVKKTTLKIKVRAQKGDKILYFESDTMPLTHAVILGGKLEDRYPKVLKQVLKEMKELRIEMKSRMLDLVGTFEEITKKGSLF